MKKVYISGKITGLHRLDVITKFAAAEMELKKHGYHVVNPVNLDHSKNINENYDEYMKTDLAAMMACNTIYMLPCWQHSKGAKIELQLAIQLNYNIIWAQ